MASSHNAPLAPLDCALEVGPDEWRAPGFYQLLTALVVPRPVGWISTISKSGVRNLAPYSYFSEPTAACLDQYIRHRLSPLC